MSYISKIKEAATAPAGRAIAMHLTAYGSKKFQDMNTGRDAAGGDKRGYDPDDTIQPVADPTFITRNWKTTQCKEGGVLAKNEDGTDKMFGTAPKYTLVDKEGVGRLVPVLKFLEPNDTGKTALLFIFQAFLNEFASYTGSEATLYEDHLTRVRSNADTLECGGIVATVLSINDRAVRDNNIELDECLRIWLATPRDLLDKYTSTQIPGTGHSASIRVTFVAFLLQMAHVLGNTMYDALLKPVTHKTIIGALRNLNYSQAAGQCPTFDEGFFVAIEEHVDRLTREKALKPKKPKAAAAAAAPEDADENEDESEAPEAPKPAAPKKGSGKKPAAPAAAAADTIKKPAPKKAAGKKAAAPKAEPTPTAAEMAAGWDGEEFDDEAAVDDDLYAN